MMTIDTTLQQRPNDPLMLETGGLNIEINGEMNKWIFTYIFILKEIKRIKYLWQKSFQYGFT